MDRKQAIELLGRYNNPEDKSDWNHFLESEAIMRALAARLGEDVELWGMLGLLHDIDWGLTKNNWVEHCTKAKEILEKEGFSPEFIQIIQSHAYGYKEIPAFLDKKREKKVEHALAAAETITGVIYAYALMRGGRVSDMEVKGLKKKFKDKAFAANCNREIIMEIEQTGIPLDEFFGIAIEAIKGIKEQVGLS